MPAVRSARRRHDRPGDHSFPQRQDQRIILRHQFRTSRHNRLLSPPRPNRRRAASENAPRASRKPGARFDEGQDRDRRRLGVRLAGIRIDDRMDERIDARTARGLVVPMDRSEDTTALLRGRRDDPQRQRSHGHFRRLRDRHL